ncbi:RICIN domain-containing protein [Streptomyces abikoensis]|uniref:RICIN domain-containing protein n=1 Tax=Streptomyces abikoensis TaxID=97398 RepID=A0ABW7TDQ2_9ACTN
MLTIVALGSLTPAQQAASAEDSLVPAQSVATFISPVGASTPSLEDLKRGTGMKELAAASSKMDSARVPQETIGPAVNISARAASASVTPPPADPPSEKTGQGLASGGASYPDPARAMSLAECQGKMLEGDVYLESRFSVCTGVKVNQVWLKKREPVGMSTFSMYLRGSVPVRDRTFRFEYDFTDFRRTGITQTAVQMETIKYDMPQVEPAGAKVSSSGTMPQQTMSYDQLAGMQRAYFRHNVTVAPGQGRGRDDVVFGVYLPSITTTVPAPWVESPNSVARPFVLAPRWDAAPYLSNSSGADRGGAAFSFEPTLHFSASENSPEKGVARHIKDAYDNPSQTRPFAPSKDIPGRDAKKPLHRLYYDTGRRDRNRAIAVQNCVAYFGANYTKSDIPGHSNECDEFPFATTYEGAAQKEYDNAASVNNFSVKPVLDDENRAGGTLQSSFYTKTRLLDGEDDGFLVVVNNDRSEYEYKLTNKATGKCLEIVNSSVENGARAQQWSCNGQPGAGWLVKPDGTDYRIVNANSGKCLEIENSRTDNGAPAQQWDCVDLKTQKWDKLTLPESEYSVFYNANSGLVLEIDNASPLDGAPAQQWKYGGGNGAKWLQSFAD